MSTYVSRFVQLDALTFDLEFSSLLKNQLTSIFNYFKTGCWTERYDPEVKLLLRFLVWWFSVFKKGRTIGQGLMGIKFTPGDKTLRNLKLLFILEAVIPYAYERLGAAAISTLNYNRVEKGVRCLKGVVKGLEVANFCIFLQQNRYSKLSYRLLDLPLIPAYPKDHTPIYSYQLRELLWHQLSECLMILLPLINVHRLSRYLKEWGLTASPAKPPRQQEIGAELMLGVLKCCICGEDAIIPQKDESCTFCYYCISANRLADPGFDNQLDCIHY